MALESPLVQNAQLMSSFSPYSDTAQSPRSLLAEAAAIKRISSQSTQSAQSKLSTGAQSSVYIQSPQSAQSEGSITSIESTTSSRPPELSPLEVPGPSPINSAGTVIDDSSADEGEPLTKPSRVQASVRGSFSSLNTSVPSAPMDSETPVSAIHTPSHFGSFPRFDGPVTNGSNGMRKTSPTGSRKSSTSKSSASTAKRGSLKDMPSLTTHNLRNSKLVGEQETPHAQTRQEAEEIDRRRFGGRRRTSSDLRRGANNLPYEQPWEPTSSEDEFTEFEEDRRKSATKELTEPRTANNSTNSTNFRDSAEEVQALRSALNECWTLTHTLAGLSSIHRERIFNWAGNGGNLQEAAWRSCWMLCQKLYNCCFEDASVGDILELCRNFCSDLFTIRERQDETADAVLRVSFEFNTHLYNMHDRNLPEAFRERTLEFYIALCHRLMKQRVGTTEMDDLLEVGWSLAEVLFSIRQNRQLGKQPDEELMGSAVQACWDLCDLFRNGWSQIRPDRATPRPGQTFTHLPKPLRRDENDSAEDAPATPTTIDDLSEIGAGEMITPTSNFTVYPSAAQSGSSQMSSHSSTTGSVIRASQSASEDLLLIRFKILIINAAMKTGYPRSPTNVNLIGYVKTLAPNAFGNASWELTLLENYKRFVLTDPTMRNISNTTNQSRQAPIVDVVRSVNRMMIGGKNAWLRDLFRKVVGFNLEDAENRHNIALQT